jgi:hypothetical protein
MAQDMGLFTVPKVENPSATTPEMQRVRAITAWGVFSLNVYVKSELQSEK